MTAVKGASYGMGRAAVQPPPEWERTPKWHPRCWLLRQTWRWPDRHWESPSVAHTIAYRTYRTEVQMAKARLAERYAPPSKWAVLDGTTKRRGSRRAKV